MNSESAPTGLLTHLSHLIHRYFIVFLISSYIFAGFFPRFGEWLRRISLGHASGFGETTSLSLTMVLLAVLLLNASLSLEKIRDLIRSPQLLLAGLGAPVGPSQPLALVHARSPEAAQEAAARVLAAYEIGEAPQVGPVVAERLAG